jgi:hypothetical protein
MTADVPALSRTMLNSVCPTLPADEWWKPLTYVRSYPFTSGGIWTYPQGPVARVPPEEKPTMLTYLMGDFHVATLPVDCKMYPAAPAAVHVGTPRDDPTNTDPDVGLDHAAPLVAAVE